MTKQRDRTLRAQRLRASMMPLAEIEGRLGGLHTQLWPHIHLLKRQYGGHLDTAASLMELAYRELAIARGAKPSRVSVSYSGGRPDPDR